MQGAARDRSGTRVTRFVFTLNNWTQSEYDSLTKDFAPGVKWIIIGKENGESGTSHLQGACILGTRMAFSKLKTLTGFKRAHIESMRGKPEDSLIYCSKEDSNPFIMGTLPTPGKRTDVADAVSRIQGGERLRDLAGDESGGIAIVKFHKGLTVLRSLTRPRRTTPPRIFWFWGWTGTGKTRAAISISEALSRQHDMPENDYWISSGGLTWFDGYDGQLVAVLDDFRAKHAGSFAWFLRLLDRYDMDVPFKGGFVRWLPHYIFITCPYTPKECFFTRNEHVPEDIKQLLRRISEFGGGIFEFEDGKHSSEADRQAFTDKILELCGYGGGPPTCAPNPTGATADASSSSSDGDGGGELCTQPASQPGTLAGGNAKFL